MNNIKERIMYLIEKYDDSAQKQAKQTFIDEFDYYYAIS